MMSSEEEESEKSCKVKPKRVRQRVDAGEPRNSYAAIPNFTSRPPATNGLAAHFFNGYGFGLVGAARHHQLKDLDSMAVDVVGNGLGAYLNGEVADLYKRDSPESAQLLRDILQQGRKVFAAAASEEESPCSEPPSPVPMIVSGGHGSEADGSSAPPGAKIEDEERMSDGERSTTPNKLIRPNSAEVKRARVETIVSNMMPVRCPTSAASSPVTPVNGCKKRKLYQPQQHDSGRGLLDDELTEEEGEADDEGGAASDGESPPKQRRQERESLKVQLQQMQEQLATMQQRYLQLFEHQQQPTDELGAANASQIEPCKDSCVSVSSTPPARGPNDPESGRQSCIVKNSPTSDLEWLVDSLKTELSSTLTQVIDAIIGRYVQRRASSSDEPTPPQPHHHNHHHHPSREVNLLSQMLDRKSPRTKVIDRGGRVNGHGGPMMQRLSPFPETCLKLPLFYPPGLKPPSLFCTPSQSLPGSGVTVPYSLPSVLGSMGSPAATVVTTTTTHVPPELPEQTEAMSLVVTPKKKRHKVTDTRITPRTVSRIMGGQDISNNPFFPSLPTQEQLPFMQGHPPPPPLVPVSLPTSVAIPNPSLNQSDLYASLHYDHHRMAQYMQDLSDDDQMNHGSSPAMLPPPPHGSPDTPHQYGNFLKQENGDGSDAGDSQSYDSSLAMTSTLTPMHLRKAKLMFFYVRYPSSAILKMYFPDIKFNKNNTAQLVKWFSNFREFFYIQMEKYARQSISDGAKSADELKVSQDSELLRVLNLHYNRNNHIEVPENFRYVIENTLREFFKAILGGKDQEQSWKKAIYKVIARMDDTVPEYFKSPNFLEQLE